MATMSTEQKRKAVQDVKKYKGDKWTKKVKAMPDNQIVRLFQQFQERRLIKL